MTTCTHTVTSTIYGSKYKSKWKFIWQNLINFQTLIFRTSHKTHTELSLGTSFGTSYVGEASEIQGQQHYLYNGNSLNVLGVYHIRILVFEQVTKYELQRLVQHCR